MRWHHGQMVQGAPGIQERQSLAAGASETGLPALPRGRRSLPTRGHRHRRRELPEPRAAGYPRRVQTPERAGLRGPVRRRHQHLFHGRSALGGEVRVSETPAHQSGDSGEEQREPECWRRRRRRRRRFWW